MPRTVLADWAVWVPLNYLNFKFVPVMYQGLYVGVISSFYNILLSYIAFQNVEDSATGAKTTLDS